MAKKRPDIITHSDGAKLSASGRPQWLQQRLDWFMDQRFGLILHWGPYCQWDCCESWPLVPADTWARPDGLKCWQERGRDLARFSRDYRALNRTFNPRQFDPAAWADLAQAAGCRYVTFTTKHHDGFCMFDTATTDYRVTHPDCPFHDHPRANIVREVFNAFRAKDLAISCYFSKSDWHCPWYWAPDGPAVDRNPNYDTHARPEVWAQFIRFVHRQIEELMTGYGPLDVLWLDGGQVRPPDQDIQMAKLAAMARSHQPGLIMVDRTVGGDYEDVITPEQEIPKEPLLVPWESCLTLGRSWKFVPNDAFKPARAVVHMLAETVSKGGNLLLGVGPTPDGTIPEGAAARLREIGAWLRVNGEAIYGTRPLPPCQQGQLRFTRKGRQGYAIILAAGDDTPPPSAVRLDGLGLEAGSTVELLGHRGPLAWQADDRGATITLPGVGVAAAPAWVLKFVLK